MEEFYPLAMILSIGIFTLTSTVSPGPNNIMLLSSGLTFGYKKTIPHILGIMIGLPFMVFVIGLGLGIIFEKFPIIFTILKIVGISYLFWMAYKIANNTRSLQVENVEDSKPFTFFQSAFFQWINPKAWIMAITSISIFVTSKENSIEQVIIISLIFIISEIFATNFWVLGGVFLRRFIKDETNVRKFNILMALLLVVSVIPFIFE